MAAGSQQKRLRTPAPFYRSTDCQRAGVSRSCGSQLINQFRRGNLPGPIAKRVGDCDVRMSMEKAGAVEQHPVTPRACPDSLEGSAEGSGWDSSADFGMTTWLSLLDENRRRIGAGNDVGEAV